mmetsp:Transcript_35576/g.46814  ORF Transcript_35576/g.46814 Transcript_35576/m.46814 type:complete len:133 (+) Transcript_35576:308-706(+)
MHSRKFDNLYTGEEKALLESLEQRQFASSLVMKGVSVFLLMHLRLTWRPVGRPWLFDFGLLYFSAYAFLGSNIPGVWRTWPEYKHLAKRMFESEKMRKRGIRSQTDFLNESRLEPDFKAVYYRNEMELARYY